MPTTTMATAPTSPPPSTSTNNGTPFPSPPIHDSCNDTYEAHSHDDNDDTLSRMRLASSNKIAGRAIAPFLARHIPAAYAPTGTAREGVEREKDPSTKFCYRHRPDLKCRRTADEPSMDHLQRELESLSQADQQGISHVWSLFSAAPAKHRNLILQGILTQCCFPQLSYLSTAVRDLTRIDFITALPSEISFKILCYLDTTSLCKAAQVNQRWRSLADDDVVWHKMCEQHIDRKCVKCGWGLPLLERKRLRDWKRQQQLRATGRGLNEWSPQLTPQPEASDSASIPRLELAATGQNGRKRSASSSLSDDGHVSPTQIKKLRTIEPAANGVVSRTSTPRFRPWKEVYKDRFKVGTNWKYGRCTTKVFRGHTNGVMCLQFDDSILATGSYDTTIKIWDIDTGEELRTLRGHTSGIRSLQFDDTKLISGSLDRMLKVWNWRTGECMSTYQGHTGGIMSLHFDGNLLASGSVDKSVKIWNFSDKSTFSLKGHRDWVNAVKVDSASRTVFSASDDCSIKLWDLDSKACIKTFEGHVGQVQQVLSLPADYEPELDDPSPTADDASSNASSADLPQPTDLRSSFGPAFTAGYATNRPLPPRYMLTGALDSTVRLWDVYTGRCLKTFFGHVEGVWALAGDTLRVVSGAEDRMVKMWDARTGRCERTFAGHAGPVTCIGLSDSRICTGSEDCEVRLQSFKGDLGEGEGGV
ncbi:hypothetical protein VC83_05913 [Pseudogymnoascus destructans]|uniref:F-box domain-containing protein n=2 Tax=Pseudogymnoascus destructans TaxID=655981 RepID=L8G2J6_PSED2|nr:uncharacterized protein VC83_05913 [Pseudogymnoascus destructans]ELR06908.1 hypothetical protein GMDG_02278 [Pseudogymnoascus destructans 20631-21]OAF57116.1 hypothetical protein VC83_05913 [Pseudogymnoascus destructans]